MHRTLLAASVIVLSASVAAWAQEAPQPSAAGKEHAWLKKFVGEWETQGEASPGPGLPAITVKGKTTARSLGDLWMISEGEVSIDTLKINNVLTLGYDPEKKKYVGTWIDSMFNHLWKYEGEVSADGKTITLEADGPDMSNPGKTAKYRDVYEFKSDDSKVLKSSLQGPDGKWVEFMSVTYKRVK